MSRDGRAQFAPCDMGGTVGGWTLKSEIGAGGTARVFLAERAQGEVAAVKLMHAHLAELWSVRFEREARLLKALKHPAIPELYEFGRERSTPYLVLELLKGTSLERRRASAGEPASLQDVLEYSDQALAALSFMHERGVVHRDLKPSNLFVTTSGALKVLDFGAATEPERSLQDSQSVTNGLLGTPAYMSPEQARGRWDMVDQRSDIWSFGAVLFTLLCGEHVHPACTRNEQLGLAISSSARSLASVRPDLDRAIIRVIDRALAYEREDRFQNADDFRSALRAPSSAPKFSISDETDATVRELPRVHRHRGSRPSLSLGLASMLSTPIVCAWALSSSSPVERVARASKLASAASIAVTSATAAAAARTTTPAQASVASVNVGPSLAATRSSKPSRHFGVARRAPAVVTPRVAAAPEATVPNEEAKPAPSSDEISKFSSAVDTAWDRRASSVDSTSSAGARANQPSRDFMNPLDTRE